MSSICLRSKNCLQSSMWDGSAEVERAGGGESVMMLRASSSET